MGSGTDVPPPVEAVSIALRRDGRLLLVRRGRPPSRGSYAFPGGRVELGETLEAAARRELWEEAGVSAGPLAIHQVLDLPAEDDSQPSFRLTVFRAAFVAGTLAAGDDAEEAGFFSLAEMAKLPVLASVFAVARELLGEADCNDYPPHAGQKGVPC